MYLLNLKVFMIYLWLFNQLLYLIMQYCQALVDRLHFDIFITSLCGYFVISIFRGIVLAGAYI